MGQGSNPTDRMNPRSNLGCCWTERRWDRSTFSKSPTLRKAWFARRAFRCAHSVSTGFRSGAYLGRCTTLSHARSANSRLTHRAVCEQWWSHTSTTGAPQPGMDPGDQIGQIVLGDGLVLGPVDQAHPPVSGVDAQPPVGVEAPAVAAREGDQRALATPAPGAPHARTGTRTGLISEDDPRPVPESFLF